MHGPRSSASPSRSFGAARLSFTATELKRAVALSSSCGYARATAPEQIERNVLLGEFRTRLTPDQEVVYANKLAGYSSDEVGCLRGSSAAAVDVVVRRLLQPPH
jgi:hypothetical protein